MLLLEYIPLLLIGGALFPEFKPNELTKIIKTFENINFGIKQNNSVSYPQFIGKMSDEHKTTYTFQLPFGLRKGDLHDILSDTLGKHVTIDGTHRIDINVYHYDLPTKWGYSDIPDIEGWQVPIGKSYDGLIWHDFDKLPHMTVAGTTRFGKTVFLKVAMTYLIEHHPHDVDIYIIDLKGGLEFNRFRNLKQIKGLATSADEALSLLTEIVNKSHNDMQYFKAYNYNNVTQAPVQKRTFIFVDEGAELTPNDRHDKTEKECQDLLSYVARVTGGLGYRLIFGTQYPTADTLPRQIKQNAVGKMSFRLSTSYASKVAIDEVGAESLICEGRMIYAKHDRQEMQAPYISDSQMWHRLRGWEVESAEDKSVAQNIIELG